MTWVTLKDVTRIMHKIEKIISFYNRKYNFKIENATDKERREYESLLKQWDVLKSKRDSLIIQLN
jgi:hypothetical protein